MSFLSAIGTIFKSAATGVAKLGDAVRGVGAAAFTASAATGASAAGGGLSSLFSGGTLGSMFKGVSTILSGGPGSILGAAAGAPAALGTALAGGAGSTLAGAAGTATGLAPEVLKSGGEGTGFLKFLSGEGGVGLLGGAAEGLGKYMEAKDAAEERQKDRDALRDRERRITEGYDVGMDALVGGDAVDSGNQRPTPAQAYARDAWTYNSKSGRVELKRAS